MNTGLYSPKIREDLIPDLYHMAKAEGTKMTKLVNRILETEIKKRKERSDERQDKRDIEQDFRIV